MFGAKSCYLDGYKCPRCLKNYGYLFTNSEGNMFFCGDKNCLQDDRLAYLEIKRKKEEQQSRYFSEDFAVKNGIGDRYRNASLAKWLADDNSKELVNKWINNPRNFLVVIGPPGVGKTYLCVAIANYLINHKRQVFYTNQRRYFERIQKAIGSNQNQYEEIRKISQNEILIYDDLGASTNSEWQKEVMLDLIDQRYSENRPTIITSNLGWNAMKELLGERTQRRINSEDNTIIIVSSEVFENAKI